MLINLHKLTLIITMVFNNLHKNSVDHLSSTKEKGHTTQAAQSQGKIHKTKTQDHTHSIISCKCSSSMVILSLPTPRT